MYGGSKASLNWLEHFAAGVQLLDDKPAMLIFALHITVK
jgi:hypothetical protein